MDFNKVQEGCRKFCLLCMEEDCPLIHDKMVEVSKVIRCSNIDEALQAFLALMQRGYFMRTSALDGPNDRFAYNYVKDLIPLLEDMFTERDVVYIWAETCGCNPFDVYIQWGYECPKLSYTNWEKLDNDWAEDFVTNWLVTSEGKRYWSDDDQATTDTEKE